MKKGIAAAALCLVLLGSMYMSAQAGEWKWEDNDGNNVAECYYYDDGFYKNCDEEFKNAMHFWNMVTVNNTIRTTPDGYQINAARQWIVDGVVQTQKIEAERPPINTQIPYDPEHPLERFVDAWNLRLVDADMEAGTMGTVNMIHSWNVQARLTNQMDKYVDIAAKAPLVDGCYSWKENGSSFQILEEDYLEGKQHEQAVYEWFCQWLNSMDLENMTEMERARAIADTLVVRSYDYEYANLDGQHARGRDGAYEVLINKKGVCSEYVSAARSMAKSVGLKSAAFGSGNHACYFIQVDGLPYRGDNGFLQLEYSYYAYETTPDYISVVSFFE